MNHQIERIRSALAIASTLGRALIVPQLWCGQDRWWAPHAGERLGAVLHAVTQYVHAAGFNRSWSQDTCLTPLHHTPSNEARTLNRPNLTACATNQLTNRRRHPRLQV